jgi:3'(2'), 5'-bisphosphate nucleotidase
MASAIPDFSSPATVDRLVAIVKRASREILDVYDSSDFEVEAKADDSPLTEADRRSNAVILEDLQREFPGIPILSEETKAVDYSERKDWSAFWLVDPLDGTKEFIKRNGEFTVNIALVVDGEPVFGIVGRPVGGDLFYGGRAYGSYKLTREGTVTPLANPTHYRDLEEVVVVASRSHLTDAVTAFVEELRSSGKKVEFLSAGSSLKLCLVAEGRASVYPRLGPTMEWDTAAAHAVALGAGRSVLDFESREPLRYNKENLLNPFFIVE